MSRPSSRTLNRELQMMSWGLALLIAVIALFLLMSFGTLSGASIAGLLTGISATVRFALAVLLDA